MRKMYVRVSAGTAYVCSVLYALYALYEVRTKLHPYINFENGLDIKNTFTLSFLDTDKYAYIVVWHY